MLSCMCIDWCKSLFHEALFVYFLDESKMKNGQKLIIFHYPMTKLVQACIA